MSKLGGAPAIILASSYCLTWMVATASRWAIRWSEEVLFFAVASYYGDNSRRARGQLVLGGNAMMATGRTSHDTPFSFCLLR